MVYYNEKFDTKEAAEKWRQREYELYHPAGYGTYLYEPVEKDGKWVVTGSRASSCD